MYRTFAHAVFILHEISRIGNFLQNNNAMFDDV